MRGPWSSHFERQATSIQLDVIPSRANALFQNGMGSLGWAQCYWCSRWEEDMYIPDSEHLQAEYGNIIGAPWCADCLEQEQCWRCLRWGNHDGPLCSHCDRQRCELLVWYCFTRLLEEAERQQADSFSQVTESVAPSSPLAECRASESREQAPC